MSNDAAAEEAGSAENGDDADTHRENNGKVETPPVATSDQHRARSRRSSGRSLNRPIDHSVDLARHDEIILVRSLDLLGA
jgi:hypothetical protein